MRRRAEFLPLSLLIAVVAFSSCSKALSRSTAAKLIKANDRFAEPLSVKVPVGKVWFDYRNFYDTFPVRDLEKAGLVNVFETGRTSGMWTKEYAVRLTPAGERQATSWKKTNEKIDSWFAPPSPEAVIYLMPVANRAIDEVTGIRSEGAAESNQAIAEFTWHWKTTEGGRLLSKSAPSEQQKTEALLQRYDDGWRVSQIHLTMLD